MDDTARERTDMPTVGLEEIDGSDSMVSIAELLSAKQQLKEAEKKYKENKKATKPKPQKSYLSRNDREELMILAAIAGKFEELLENWYQFQRPQKRITYIKTALTYTYKSMDNYFDGLTGEQKKEEIYRLLRDLNQCNIYLERGGQGLKLTK